VLSLWPAAILLLGGGCDAPRARRRTTRSITRADVKPVFAHRCAGCHGAAKQRAGLRVDAAALLLKGGVHGAVVVPGRASESRLVHAITGTHGVKRMPAEGEPLTPGEIETIKRWIDEGATSPAGEEIPAGPEAHWRSSRPCGRPFPRSKIGRGCATRWTRSWRPSTNGAA
jgi:mono/diheme cytochrome c family protein